MKSSALKLPAFAKINWFLHILGKRPADQFHEICTSFQTISLHDTLTFEIDDKITLSCNVSGIPNDEENLIIKAAELLKRKFNVKQGARIRLEKVIPSPGGLGGGSSNAAIALMGLATLWKLKIRNQILVEIGSKIGADVPFFFYGGTSLGSGIGTEITNVKDINENYILLITPDISISTVEAYRNLNALYLTKKDQKSILTVCRTQADRLFDSDFQLFNDFEKSVFKKNPEIKLIKDKLLSLNAKNALMSGSGASVFGIFDNEEKRQIAFDAFDEDKNIRKFAVNTISRREYISCLEPCKHLIPMSL